MAPLRLGTRQSTLALTQSRWVAKRLEAAAGVEVELVPIVTRGDRHPGDLAEVGGKGLFTEELEAGLLEERLDLAVHSLKDLPVELPAGLTVAAFPERADPRDALISECAERLSDLPPGAVVLTGSQRRRAQLLAQRPDLDVRPVRGNVDTRLAKRRRLERDKGLAGGTLLAMAGLDRLGIGDEPIRPLAPDEMLPAPGQGTLAVEVKIGSAAQPLCRLLNHVPTERAAIAERLVVRALGGDCTLPLAAWARDETESAGQQPRRLRLSALLATLDGQTIARGEGLADTPEQAASECVEMLFADGAREVLSALGKTT